ncbi:hypothetical protein FOPG_18813 [Fusarium oxysporum f. sp. conglutinans race 2 54008]|uniref:Uncharacterized protein n=1 Tax=Fusarium oxysporum f. sp. conglutinans race 2 54008 TaxID=1089457 RepID=X0GYQ6_FUSOX|nr:hypothetical protein FOPG_18813 [Fusarium oxysporum f. sp. conglutinans race 2 54008]
MAQLDGIVTFQDVRTNWLEMAHREKQMWKGTRYAIYNETTVV